MLTQSGGSGLVGYRAGVSTPITTRSSASGPPVIRRLGRRVRDGAALPVVPDSATVQDVSNVADLVRRAAAERPDRPALRWHGGTTTWAELDGQVDAVAAGLTALDLPYKGWPARVAVALPNVPEFAIWFFGALRAGLIAVPINPELTGRELAHAIRDSGAGVLVGTPDVLAAVATAGATPPHTYQTGHAFPAARAPGPAETGGEDLAVLLYTSGTAGAPKGAMLSHRALLANHEQLARLDPPPVGPDDIVLLALPLFHAYGLNCGLGAVAYHGACGVLMERFDPADALELIVDEGITTIVGVPPMYVAWSSMGDRLAESMRGVRIAVSGAAPLEPAIGRRFAQATGRPVHEGYGLTETAPVVTSTLASTSRKPGSIGQPIPGVDLKLRLSGGAELIVDGPLDEDDFDDDAPGSPGSDPGEIAVRGPNLFSGYWPDGHDRPDSEGWWPTGDVAYADAEGDLFLVDRIGELILVNGFNVYPHEVEQVLVGHPAVRDAAVLGVTHPHTGQSVKAYVVRDDDLTADELIAYCERHLARFKCPTAVEFVSDLPHSPIGKVRKAALRAGL
jgi:long-chain acyl-CoA synthetase